MTRINTNIPSLIAQTRLSRTGDDLNTRLQRLSTGLRINRGADDPAGLIVSESLRTELAGLRQAIDNSERASSVIATTEGYLAEVADLLNSIKGLVVEAANTGGLSDEEIEANQLQIDSALESVTRIANTASFAGLQLLNGSLDYITSGIDDANIDEAHVRTVQFGSSSNIQVDVEIVASAQTATLFLSGNNTGFVGALESSVTLEIAGNKGVQTINFVSGTTYDDVVNAINTIKEATGVSASLVSAGDTSSGLVFNSTAFGSDQFTSVRAIGEGGDFFSVYDAQGGNLVTRDEGRDVSAIINGALAVGDGLDIALNTPSLAVDLTLDESFATTQGGSDTFYITGGGATFQLGPDISAIQQIGVGVQSIAASRIGGLTHTDGSRYYLDSLQSGKTNALGSGNEAVASEVLDAAIGEISVLRGRLGAFERNTLDTNIRALQIGVENISTSESKIRDTDFAAETAALTRAQILQQAGTSVLATANTTAQNVLSLLG